MRLSLRPPALHSLKLSLGRSFFTFLTFLIFVFRKRQKFPIRTQSLRKRCCIMPETTSRWSRYSNQNLIFKVYVSNYCENFKQEFLQMMIIINRCFCETHITQRFPGTSGSPPYNLRAMLGDWWFSFNPITDMAWWCLVRFPNPLYEVSWRIWLGDAQLLILISFCQVGLLILISFWCFGRWVSWQDSRYSPWWSCSTISVFWPQLSRHVVYDDWFGASSPSL